MCLISLSVTLIYFYISFKVNPYSIIIFWHPASRILTLFVCKHSSWPLKIDHFHFSIDIPRSVYQRAQWIALSIHWHQFTSSRILNENTGLLSLKNLRPGILWNVNRIHIGFINDQASNSIICKCMVNIVLMVMSALKRSTITNWMTHGVIGSTEIEAPCLKMQFGSSHNRCPSGFLSYTDAS